MFNMTGQVFRMVNQLARTVDDIRVLSGWYRPCYNISLVMFLFLGTR